MGVFRKTPSVTSATSFLRGGGDPPQFEIRAQCQNDTMLAYYTIYRGGAQGWTTYSRCAPGSVTNQHSFVCPAKVLHFSKQAVHFRDLELRQCHISDAV